MRRGDTSGDEALKEVIDDPSGDPKGWFVIIRDGPLTHDSDYRNAKPSGNVYVLWRKTRELAIEQLKLHQKVANDENGAPLRELHPTVFSGECNFGFYEDGSFLLINADRDVTEQQVLGLEKKLREAEKSMPIPRELLKKVGHTHTDPYTCPGCLMDKYETAEVILGDGGDGLMWCSLECFRKKPPEGWIHPEIKGLILERDGAEKAEELMEEKLETLHESLAFNEQQIQELENELHDWRSDADYENDLRENEMYEQRSTFEEARRSLVVELTKSSMALTESSHALTVSSNKIRGLEVRCAELECMIDNDPEPIGKYCGKTCSASTGICGSPTYGWGVLSPNGYWEYPCDLCANQEYPMAKLDNSQIISHDNLPDDVNHLIAQAANKAVTKAAKKVGLTVTCSVCNKVLAHQKGLQDHQRSTKCGKVQAMVLANALADKAKTKATGKTETVYLAEINYKRDVLKFQAAQTLVRWLSTAAAVTAVAYHIV